MKKLDSFQNKGDRCIWSVSVSPLHDQYKCFALNIQESRISGQNRKKKMNKKEN